MSKKIQNSVSVTFVSQVESVADKSQVKAAYKDLCKQITAFAETLVSDPNVIISHSSVNIGTEAPKAKADAADTKMAELQTTHKRLEKGNSPAVTPGYKSKFEPAVEEKHDEESESTDEAEEPARVVSGVSAKHWVPPTSTTVAPETKTADPALKNRMHVTIFSNTKKTAKSLAIVDFFLSNMDKDLSISEICEGTKLKNSAVNSWLAQTGKDIKAIKGAEKRGHYRFDSSKIKVY